MQPVLDLGCQLTDLGAVVVKHCGLSRKLCQFLYSRGHLMHAHTHGLRPYGELLALALSILPYTPITILL
jgi:hypothetical protein